MKKILIVTFMLLVAAISWSAETEAPIDGIYQSIIYGSTFNGEEIEAPLIQVGVNSKQNQVYILYDLDGDRSLDDEMVYFYSIKYFPEAILYNDTTGQVLFRFNTEEYLYEQVMLVGVNTIIVKFVMIERW
jgi:hypothetical protein